MLRRLLTGVRRLGRLVGVRHDFTSGSSGARHVVARAPLACWTVRDPRDSRTVSFCTSPVWWKRAKPLQREVKHAHANRDASACGMPHATKFVVEATEKVARRSSFSGA